MTATPQRNSHLRSHLASRVAASPTSPAATAATSAGLPDGTAPSVHPPAAAPGSLNDRLRAAAQAMREGRPVLLTDDRQREDEADLIVAAEVLSAPVMAALIRDGSGIVCLCLTPAQAAHLGLEPMVRDNRSRHGTAFTVSIEAREGVSTGVSAADRVATVRAATEPGRSRADIVSPGHVFPLVAHEGGVLARRGHTEGALELCALAGLRPAAVLCELMNPDGTMARGPQMWGYAEHHGLPVLSIEDLVAWRHL